MKMYKILAIIAFLSLIPLSVFSMETVPFTESKGNEKPCKKFYAWHKGNESHKSYKKSVESFEEKARLNGFKLDQVLPSSARSKGYADIYNFLQSINIVPKKFDLTDAEKDRIKKTTKTITNVKDGTKRVGSSEIFDDYMDNVWAKYDKNQVESTAGIVGMAKVMQAQGKNIVQVVQAKWKNIAKAVAVASVPFVLAHYYLRNKHVVSDIVGNNVVSRCADTVAQHYHQAPYRPLANIVFGSIFDRIPYVGWIVSNCAKFVADRATGFTHFSSFVQTGNGKLLDLFATYILSIPEKYATNHFKKVWNYKADLLQKWNDYGKVKAAAENEFVLKKDDAIGLS